MQEKGYTQIQKRIAAFSDIEVVNAFFELLARLLKHLNLAPNDPRVALYVRNDYRKRFTVNVGAKIAMALSNANGVTTIQFRIRRNQFASLAQRLPLIDVFGDEMKNEEEIMAGIDAVSFFAHPDEDLLQEWLNTCVRRLPRRPGNASNEHFPLMWEMAANPEVRSMVIQGTSEDLNQKDNAVNYYLVGAVFNDEKREDQTVRFVQDGIWINGRDDGPFAELTKSVEIGDRLAIKATWADSKERVGYLRIKALGTVTANRGDGKQLEVKWDQGIDPFDLPGEFSRYRKTIELVDDDAHIQAIFFHEPDRQRQTMTAIPLNQILYGPPGTGKTYSTITESAYILTGEDHSKRYSEAKVTYKSTLGDQIEFITFHQNYSYEDFVAGLRPDTSVTEALAFKEHKGIFYEICERARKNLKLSQEHAAYIEPEFQDVFDAFLQPLRDDESAEIKLATEAENAPFYITRINKNNLSFRKNSGGTGHTLSFNTLQELYEGRRVFSRSGISIYLRPVVNRLHAMAESMRSKTAPVMLKNYVLIIDEINRANISRVFGELITLLEEDKRLGNKHEMEISLPNGERFSVPKNLYLIGTMNTADKSIALLDIALRRRFQFKPMFPKEELVRDPAQQQFLRSLNTMILKERGADFLVGHAYLMADENEEKRFDEVMNNQIIPLLKEYFYNDGADKVLDLLQSAAQVPGFEFIKDAYLGVTCNARL